MTGFTEEVAKALSLRKYGISYEGLVYVFGKDENYWYRMEIQFGRKSIVGATVNPVGKHRNNTAGAGVYLVPTNPCQAAGIAFCRIDGATCDRTAEGCNVLLPHKLLLKQEAEFGRKKSKGGDFIICGADRKIVDGKYGGIPAITAAEFLRLIDS